MKKRMKVGRRMVTLPSVKSMTEPDPAAPATKPADGEPTKPTEEPSDDLTRMIKAAYQ